MASRTDMWNQNELALNTAAPTVLWVDMNASFARAEQQARALLRGKPVAVAAHVSDNGCVVSPSVEAKALGVKTGMRVADARTLVPDIVILPPSPNLYREIHRRFCRVYREVTPDVTPKSIDEACLDVADTPALKVMTMEEIGGLIKRRVRETVGHWMSCNVGIGPNRFLAKLAAGLHKPDGLDRIDHTNLREVYATLKLTDLPGINVRYEARLNAAGIFTPLQFLDAPYRLLLDEVFQSIVAHHWYLRLRGYEVDDVDFETNSVGHSRSLRKQTADPAVLGAFLTLLSKMSGFRMRKLGLQAGGVYVGFTYADGSAPWGKGRKVQEPVYTDKDILVRAVRLMNEQPRWAKVHSVTVTAFGVEPAERNQLVLFDDEAARARRLSDAVDMVNATYGDFMVAPATLLGMEDVVLDRISFGSIRDIAESYEPETALVADDWGA